MIIYDPKITGSFDVNGTSISSLDQIDVTSGSVSSLNDATSSYALIAEISGSTTSLSSSIASELLKNTTDTLTGDLTVTGTVTAQEFHTEYISASITYESGSHKFGDSYDDVHEFTGSVNVSNSLNGVSGSYTFVGGNFTVEGDDADFNLNITSGSALANLTEFRFQTDGGTMGRLYMHKGTKHMYLGPTYFPTSSLFLQDGTGTVMSITGSRVGIGTAEPQAELDIRTSNQQAIYAYTDGGYNALEFTSDGGTTTGSLLAYNNTVRLGNASNVGGFSNGIIIDSNGNVGIGTNNPERFLHIFTSNVQIGALIQSSNATSAQLNFKNASTTNNGGFVKTTGDNIVLAANSTAATHLVVASGGNVGINNVNPLARLQITTGDSGASSAWSNADELILESSGNAGLAFQTPNTGAATIAFQDPESVQAGFIQYLHGDNLMRFATNGNNIRAIIDSSGRLSVNDTVSGNFLTNYDTKLLVGGEIIARSLTANESMVSIGGDSNGAFIKSGKQDGSLTDRPLNFITGEDIRISIASSGNVGINSTGPAYKLDVVGNARFTEQLKVEQPIVTWSDSGTKHYTHLATFSGYGSAASALIINTNIPGHNQSGNGNMFTFRIVGYAYASYGLIDMLVGCYAGENNYYSAWWTGTGQTNWVDNVYVYTNSSGKVAFQIGETTDTLAAEIAITDFVQGFGNVNTSYADSWSCSAVTTLPTQTNKVTLGYKAIAPDIYQDVTFHDSVGIGTTSITKRLEVAAETNTDGIRIQGSNANATLTIQNNGTGGNAWDISSTGAGHGYGNGNLIFGVTFSPKVTFKSDGTILNGGHAANDGVSPTLNGWGLSPNGTATAVCNFSDSNEMVVLNQRDGQGTTQFEFRNGNVERGRIEWTTSGTTYNTNSDYRLKENVTNLTGSLAKIDQLEPKAFNFISDPDEPKIGFIAHEVQNIVPQAVSGVKDAVREDGTPKYQGLDHSMLVPLLVGAIKELKADNEALKARIETLENS